MNKKSINIISLGLGVIITFFAGRRIYKSNKEIDAILSENDKIIKENKETLEELKKSTDEVDKNIFFCKEHQEKISALINELDNGTVDEQLKRSIELSRLCGVPEEKIFHNFEEFDEFMKSDKTLTF